MINCYQFTMIPFLICPMYQLLSAGLLPGGATLLTYYFLYWRRLLAKTKTESLTVNKAEVLQLFLLKSTCLPRVNSQQPWGCEPDKRLRQTVSCFHLGWVMWTVLWSGLAAPIIDVRTWARWSDCSVGLTRWSRGQRQNIVIWYAFKSYWPACQIESRNESSHRFNCGD